jgi:dTDP-4-dehydrorhamnose reductase
MSQMKTYSRILLFGKTGQVGTQFARLGGGLGPVLPVDRAACDLTHEASVREFVLKAAPACIVNAAAYTAVDKAENDEAVCFAVNAHAPGAMAEAARELGIPMVHYSTDYVFDGQKTSPYLEHDVTGPLGVYGRSKLEGEERIAAAKAEALVLRTSWVYGAEGQNFLRTMLRIGATRPEMRVVADQFGSPTSSKAISAATVRILLEDQLSAGVFHMTAGGSTSWFDFAEQIFVLAEIPSRPKLTPITTEEYPTPARRPRNSVLSNEKFSKTFGFRLAPWEESLQDEMASVNLAATALPKQ